MQGHGARSSPARAPRSRRRRVPRSGLASSPSSSRSRSRTSQARADLAASRARVVAAADDERRRVVRDLHDGAQQRLVHTIVTLQLAQRAQDDAEALVAEALDEAQHAMTELRELAHGILPSVLTRGGLRPAVEALASRTPVPVDVAVGRGPSSRGGRRDRIFRDRRGAHERCQAFARPYGGGHRARRGRRAADRGPGRRRWRRTCRRQRDRGPLRPARRPRWSASRGQRRWVRDRPLGQDPYG
jgi:Histidine kinase